MGSNPGVGSFFSFSFFFQLGRGRGIRTIGAFIFIDVLVIPSTCIRERDIVIAPLVRVCVCLSVCLSVCLHLIASELLLVLPSIQLVVSSVLFDGTFLRVSIYPFKLSCPASWLFRLLLSPSFLVVAMIF